MKLYCATGGTENFIKEVNTSDELALAILTDCKRKFCVPKTLPVPKFEAGEVYSTNAGDNSHKYILKD